MFAVQLSAFVHRIADDKYHPISSMYQGDMTDQEIGDGDSEDTGESTLSSHIEDDDLEHQQEVLHLGQEHWDKSLRTTKIPLPRNGAVPKLSLHSLLVQHPEIYLRRWHYQCTNAKCHPSSMNYTCLTVHLPPGLMCFPTSPVETRIFQNPRPVVIRTFPNTKRLVLR